MTLKSDENYVIFRLLSPLKWMDGMKTILVRLLIVTALFPLFSFSLLNPAAARVSVSVQQDTGLNFSIVYVEGDFEYGDQNDFLQKVMHLNRAVVVLNSSGGNVIAAIEIGKIIRLKSFNTAVLSKSLCASACALTWLAGVERLFEDGAAIGFHASYINENGRNLETGLGNALVGRYLTQLNLPESAVVFVTSAPPEGMNWLTTANALKAGINIRYFSSGNENKAVIENAPSVQQDNPISVASKFYNFLSKADGAGAAALVIPEKRGKGPFNEQNIANFFGTLRSPLRVLSISSVSHNQVAVTYVYQKNDGADCKATANVYTTVAYGRTLIERISAKC